MGDADSRVGNRQANDVPLGYQADRHLADRVPGVQRRHELWPDVEKGLQLFVAAAGQRDPEVPFEAEADGVTEGAG